jgi:hypothetical protein
VRRCGREGIVRCTHGRLADVRTDVWPLFTTAGALHLALSRGMKMLLCARARFFKIKTE